MDRPVTALLHAWSEGDETALEELVPLVHGELRRVAARYMAGERPSHTLQPTALVNELYLRLTGVNRIRWQNRAHFFAVAASLMRRVLVDFARSRKYQKRGGDAKRVVFDEAIAIDVGRGHELTALDDALETLARLSPRQSRIVEMRFFAGLGIDEIASALEISAATVMRDWKLAKTWLLRELDESARGSSR